jgi:hypothetical protein
VPEHVDEFAEMTRLAFAGMLVNRYVPELSAAIDAEPILTVAPATPCPEESLTVPVILYVCASP